MGFLDELKRLTHPYEDDMEDDYDEDEDLYEDEDEEEDEPEHEAPPRREEPRAPSPPGNPHVSGAAPPQPRRRKSGEHPRHHTVTGRAGQAGAV